MPYIYKIVNDINDKVYVGKTTRSIEERFKEHCKDRKRRMAEKRPLYDAMNKYGVEHFHVELIEECSIEESSSKEIYWIKELNSYHNGYNATLGGDGRPLVNHNIILQLWNDGLNINQIAKNIGIGRDTVSSILEGNGISKEEKQERGWLTQPQVQAVVMLDKDTLEELKIFCSSKEAGRYLGDVRKSTHIRDVCKGIRKTAYGYKWKYIDNIRA